MNASPTKNKGFFSQLSNLDDLVALGGQPSNNTDREAEPMDFDFLDMYANKVREQTHALK